MTGYRKSNQRWQHFFGLITLFSYLLVSTTTYATPVKLELYGQLPAFEMAAISPTGERIALVATIGESRRILVLDSQNKLLKSFSPGDVKLVSLVWASEDLLLVHHRNTATMGLGFTADKGELGSYVVVRISDGKIWDVFSSNKMVAGGVRRFYGLVNRGPQTLGYFSALSTNKNGQLSSLRPDLYEIDLNTGITTKVSNRTNGPIWQDWIVDDTGTLAVQMEYDAYFGSWQLRDHKLNVLTKNNLPKGNVALHGMGKEGNSIIYSISDPVSDEIHFMEVDLAGGDNREILTELSPQFLVFDKFTRRLVGYSIKENEVNITYFDSLRNKIVSAINKAFPGLRTTLIDSSTDFRHHIVLTEGPEDVGTWWTVNIDTGQAIELGHSYLIPANQMGEVRMIQYQAQDGLKMEGVLTLPPGTAHANLPVVMLPHGGPTMRDYAVFYWWAQAFAAQGYAVFQPNFRGSLGYGTEFERAGDGEWGRKMQTDISDGLTELGRQGLVDIKRACIVGASYGGYAALAGVTLQQGIYRCAVSVAGISDVNDQYVSGVQRSGRNASAMRALRNQLGSRANRKKISPINFTDHASAPILLIHGQDDIVVDASQSRDMEKALRKAGKTVQLVTLDGEDHWLSKSATRLQMLKAASEFIQKYNPPD